MYSLSDVQPDAAQYHTTLSVIQNDIAELRNAILRFGPPQYGSVEWLPQIARAHSPPEELVRRWVRESPGPTAGTGQHAQLRRRIVLLEQRIANLTDQNNALRQRVGDVLQLDRDIGQRNEEIRGLRHEAAGLRVELAARNQAFEGLQGRHRQTLQQRDAARLARDGAIGERNEAIARLQDVVGRLQRATTQLDAAAVRLQNTQDEAHQWRDRAQNLRKDLRGHRDEMIAFDRRVERIRARDRARTLRAEERVTALELVSERFQNENNRLRRRNQELRRALSEADFDVRDDRPRKSSRRTG
jgi:DNA repair exonuclease SbcCD ATPase subunit